MIAIAEFEMETLLNANDCESVAVSREKRAMRKERSVRSFLPVNKRGVVYNENALFTTKYFIFRKCSGEGLFFSALTLFRSKLLSYIDLIFFFCKFYHLYFKIDQNLLVLKRF